MLGEGRSGGRTSVPPLPQHWGRGRGWGAQRNLMNTLRPLHLALALWLTLSAVAFGAAPPAAAPALPQGVERVTTVEGITEYRLANGLRVLLFPDPSKQTLTVNVTYLVGSRNEGYGETGMAHLLEHMM